MRENNMVWDYNEEHFIRYVNLEYWRENYEEIIKTGFEFPKIFISCIKHDYSVDNKKRDTLLKKYYPNPQEENEYYPLLKLIEFTNKYPEFKDLVKPCALNYPNSVALIFSRVPRRWGLRGDPYFWTYLEERFIKVSIPLDDPNLFEDIIRKEYFRLSRKQIGEEAYIKQFAHGGMSSGSISDLWLDYIPLLKYRLIKLNNDYYLKYGNHSKMIPLPEKIIKMTRETLFSIIERYDEELEFYWK